MDAEYRQSLRNLAARGVLIGTSSWKYPGWCGLIYDEQRYITRKKLSEAKFNRECLAEYAETFHTVCVDAGYYQFPSEKWVGDMCAQVPARFKFAFKVTDDITLKHFPNLPRFGSRAGTTNENFLSADRFKRAFLPAMEAHREKIGPLIFEFSTFKKGDFAHGREFAEALDAFFAQLPKGWEYAVELRNKGWLQPEYLDVLSAHGVAHTFNNWTRMPPIEEQLSVEGVHTAPFDVARFLLAPGVAYEASVKAYQPYRELREANQSARIAGRQLLAGSLEKKRKCTIYVNNRLEGCAPLTIKALLDLLPKYRPIIEVRPEGTRWKVLVSEDMRLTYPDRADAISFALYRARSERAEVHLMTPDSHIDEVLRPDILNEM